MEAADLLIDATKLRTTSAVGAAILGLPKRQPGQG